MKKSIYSAILFLFILNIMTPNFSYASKSTLIQNAELSLKSTENPKRLEIIFNLAEPINLLKGNSDIIYEYFMEDSLGNLEAIQYNKNKLWSGYLNSYEYYPAGEHKYSSGYDKNAAFSDQVPATKIYTSTRTSSSIDVTLVAAIRITVLREDGTGEKVTVYSDGTTSAIEKIDITIGDEDKDTGIRLDTTTAELPSNTVLKANELTSGNMFDKTSAALADVKNFIVYEIKLESEGVEIQPDGKVKISIPIPDNFDNANLMVFRIDTDGTKTPYPITETIKDEVAYATFETEHFTVYALADISETKDETPKTGI